MVFTFLKAGNHLDRVRGSLVADLLLGAKELLPRGRPLKGMAFVVFPLKIFSKRSIPIRNKNVDRDMLVSLKDPPRTTAV